MALHWCRSSMPSMNGNYRSQNFQKVCSVSAGSKNWLVVVPRAANLRHRLTGGSGTTSWRDDDTRTGRHYLGICVTFKVCRQKYPVCPCRARMQHGDVAAKWTMCCNSVRHVPELPIIAVGPARRRQGVGEWCCDTTQSNSCHDAESMGSVCLSAKTAALNTSTLRLLGGAQIEHHTKGIGASTIYLYDNLSGVTELGIWHCTDQWQPLRSLACCSTTSPV